MPFRGGAMNLWAPITFDGAGRVVDIGMRLDPGGGLPVTLRLHVTSEAVVEDTVAIANPPSGTIGLHTVDRPTEDGAARFYVWQPHAPRHLVAHGPGGAWAEAVASSYRVEWRREAGETITIVGPAAPGPELFFDTEGRLWVELSVRDGADREADVYAVEGTLAGRYRWPAEVRAGLPGWTGRSTLLGVTVDSLGVQRVARVRFERAP